MQVSQHGAKKLEMTPDIDSSTLQVRVLGLNSADKAPLKLTIRSDGKEVRLPNTPLASHRSCQVISLNLEWRPFQPILLFVKVARGEGLLGSQFNITIPKMRFWSPTDPFLYDVDLEVYQSGANNTNANKV